MAVAELPFAASAQTEASAALPRAVRHDLGKATGTTMVLAGPALSVHTRSQALQQTLAGLTATTKAVQVSGDYGDFTGTLGNPSGGSANQT